MGAGSFNAMANVTVPALKPLRYQGRSYVRGELITASAIEAAAMARRGEVSLSRGHIVAPVPTRHVTALTAEPPTDRSIPTPRRRYRRRDMNAPIESDE